MRRLDVWGGSPGPRRAVEKIGTSWLALQSGVAGQAVHLASGLLIHEHAAGRRWNPCSAAPPRGDVFSIGPGNDSIRTVLHAALDQAPAGL